MRVSRILTLAALALTVTAGPALATGTVGETAPAFQLKGLDGSTHSLADHKGKVVVLEWINPNCPYSDRHAREKTMTNLAHKHGKVVWLAINSTNPDHGNYLEPAEHLAWKRERGVDYAVLYDPTGEVGKAYGAKTTPHMYIIDAKGTLVYAGGIDDKPTPDKADIAGARNHVLAALGELKAGKPVSVATSRPYGCNVKYAKG